jgi:tRNA modification GTPase
MKILKDGVNVVIIGKPNVGKSTLINLMANKNVSIVNAQAGTTRDIIETSVELEGFRVNLIDTAGLRKTEC